MNAKLAVIALVAMPLVAILTYNFGRRVMPISREVQQLKADVTEAADESVVGIEMVQAFGREDDVQARFNVKASRVRDGVLRQARVEGLFLPGLLFLPSLSIAAVVYFGGVDVINGHLTNGQFYLFYQLLLQLVWPLEALGWILSLGQRATASASRTFAWLQGIETIPEPAEPAALPDGRLGVTFENVHFSYPTGSEVLTGVDLEVAPGEVIAVCGSTGAGKTSLLNLLPRFYDPTEGRVLLGGVDVSTVPIADLRTAVAIVTQRPILFSIPLRDNLTAARPDAPWEEVVAACEAAGVAHFAVDLPDGYDTLIGERGVNLSGGQRQRVALARALIAGARVIVLDDPMSAVDTQTERHLVDEPPPRARRPHRADRDAAPVDRRSRRPRRRDRRRRRRRVGHARRSYSRAARSSPRSSARRWQLPSSARRPGLSRLKHYLPGQRLRVAALAVCGVLMAGAPVAALLIVPRRDRQGDARRRQDAPRARRRRLPRSCRSPTCCRRRSCAASHGSARTSCSACARTCSTT